MFANSSIFHLLSFALHFLQTSPHSSHTVCKHRRTAALKFTVWNWTILKCLLWKKFKMKEFKRSLQCTPVFFKKFKPHPPTHLTSPTDLGQRRALSAPAVDHYLVSSLKYALRSKKPPHLSLAPGRTVLTWIEWNSGMSPFIECWALCVLWQAGGGF